MAQVGTRPRSWASHTPCDRDGLMWLGRRDGNSLLAPRSIDPAGGSPIPAPLRGGSGAAVVYSVGTTEWATIQAY